MLKSWNELPTIMQNDKVKPYYLILIKRQNSMRIKRGVDLVGALILTVVLLPLMGVLAVWIKIDSRGSVFFRQERITRYGKPYYILKFRTMVKDADKKGPAVTEANDSRITRAGKKLRKLRLDEIPQLFNVLRGDMSFVGTRPEVKKYVEQYSDEMLATFLLPAGITSSASIAFRNEGELLEKYASLSCYNKCGTDTEKTLNEIYVDRILPIKMKYNLSYLKHFSVPGDLRIMLMTVLVMIKEKKKDNI